MLNEIILNGISSNTLQGLLIQSLPSISKPMMRSKKEEIDGRDGDIITPLGYSSYDKTFSIGLSYNYDINAIINFFDSEGTVTFSNEPDKYYNYRILDQIDFERLLRFKTATVTMHVQPFKYPTSEGPETFSRNRIKLESYNQTTSGVTVKVTEGLVYDQEIVITGNGTATFSIPIQTLTITPDRYAFSAYAEGTGAQYCEIRLIHGDPSSSFGNDKITLANNKMGTIIETTQSDQTYDYIYLSVDSNTELNIAVNISFNGTGNADFEITNSGDYPSKPVISIFGSGIGNIYLNSELLFKIDLSDDGYITIDTFNMEAYKDAVLKNRSVTGNYENFSLSPGVNQITCDGNISDITISNYSRFL